MCADLKPYVRLLMTIYSVATFSKSVPVSSPSGFLSFCRTNFSILAFAGTFRCSTQLWRTAYLSKTYTSQGPSSFLHMMQHGTPTAKPKKNIHSVRLVHVPSSCTNSSISTFRLTIGPCQGKGAFINCPQGVSRVV